MANFEEKMQQLEALVNSLEQGQMPLEESFAAFEQAKRLQDELEKMLDEGDARIRVLTETGDREMKGEAVR